MEARDHDNCIICSVSEANDSKYALETHSPVNSRILQSFVK